MWQKSGERPPLQLLTVWQLQHRQLLIQHRKEMLGGHGAKSEEIIDHERRLPEQDVTLCVAYHITDHQTIECMNGFNQGRMIGNHLLPTTVSTLCLSYPIYVRSVGFPVQG